MKTSEENADVAYMWRCIQLALNGEESVAPNPMVGAVVVYNGSIIGEGYHAKCGEAHAEVNAIASVRQRHLLPLSTLYVSLEPCAHFGKTPPCVDLIIEKRLKRVVIGCVDSFSSVNGLGIKKLREAGIEVKVGVLGRECEHLNRKFFKFHTFHRPYVTLKWAQSADGFIDRLRNEHLSGTPVQLSTPITKVLSHRLRATNDAILVGTRTALLDDPILTVRLWSGKNPVRLVIDLDGKLSHNLHLFDGQAPTRVYVQDGASPSYAGKQVTIVRVKRQQVIRDIMEDLARCNVQSVIVEGGAATLTAFLTSGVWDEARVETAPVELGNGVRAPRLTTAELHKSVVIDGNSIDVFTPGSVKM